MSEEGKLALTKAQHIDLGIVAAQTALNGLRQLLVELEPTLSVTAIERIKQAAESGFIGTNLPAEAKEFLRNKVRSQ